MSELYEKSLLKLELDQVLEQLVRCAGSEGGKEACRKLRPVSDLEDVQQMLDETTAASNLCTRKGNPVFADVTDMSASLERADRGGCLQPMELLRIAGILRCARTIQGRQRGGKGSLSEAAARFGFRRRAANAGRNHCRLEPVYPQGKPGVCRCNGHVRLLGAGRPGRLLTAHGAAADRRNPAVRPDHPGLHCRG